MHRAINSYRLLIINEIGYLPMNREQANLFFQIVAARYEKDLRSMNSRFADSFHIVRGCSLVWGLKRE